MLFRKRYLVDYFSRPQAVDFLEICTDHYLDFTPEVLAELDTLTAHFPVIPHGLDLSLGSRDGLRADYLERVLALVDRVRPPWFSDHLAFTRAGGYEIGHLAPVPLTRDALAICSRNIGRVRARTAVPLALENSAATFAFPHAEFSPGAFTAELVARTGCRLVVDVANLACDEHNLGHSAERFLDEIPRDAVVQIHIAGGHFARDVLVDSHSRPVPPRVWQLARRALEAFPTAWVTLEREEALPHFDEIARELDHARTLTHGTRVPA